MRFDFVQWLDSHSQGVWDSNTLGEMRLSNSYLVVVISGVVTKTIVSEISERRMKKWVERLNVSRPQSQC